MVTLEFHDPSGAIEVKQPFAPRVAALVGKRIGFVSNDQWQAFRMLPLLNYEFLVGGRPTNPRRKDMGAGAPVPKSLDAAYGAVREALRTQLEPNGSPAPAIAAVAHD